MTSKPTSTPPAPSASTASTTKTPRSSARNSRGLERTFLRSPARSPKVLLPKFQSNFNFRVKIARTSTLPILVTLRSLFGYPLIFHGVTTTRQALPLSTGLALYVHFPKLRTRSAVAFSSGSQPQSGLPRRGERPSHGRRLYR